MRDPPPSKHSSKTPLAKRLNKRHWLIACRQGSGTCISSLEGCRIRRPTSRGVEQSRVLSRARSNQSARSLGGLATPTPAALDRSAERGARSGIEPGRCICEGTNSARATVRWTAGGDSCAVAGRDREDSLTQDFLHDALTGVRLCRREYSKSVAVVQDADFKRIFLFLAECARQHFRVLHAEHQMTRN